MEDGTKLLYVRDDVDEMWAFLEKEARTSMVQGPPGTGKSSTTWAWVRRLAAGEKTMLWAHLRMHHAAIVVVLRSNNVTAVGPMKTSEVIPLVDCSTADIIVLDGVVSATITDLLEAADTWVWKVAGRHVVQVTSESVLIIVEMRQETGTKTHTVFSWTLMQYEAAVEKEEFKRKIAERLGPGDTLAEKLANKFFLAGGCARWMFEFLIIDATSDIDNHFAAVSNKHTLLSGLEGNKAKGSVNHLIQRLPTKYAFLVSAYAARCLAQLCELAFVEQAAVVAQDNPGFDGIVLEMDFMAQLRLAMKNNGALKIMINDSTEEEWKVLRFLKFTQPNDLKGDKLQVDRFEIKCNVADGSWLLPKLFNQVGYDAAQVVVISSLPKILVRFA
jgi:hypothetical protein